MSVKYPQWMSVIMVFVLVAAYLLLRAPDPAVLLESNDQGYQMALGMALATGRLPGFDVLTQYGPLVAIMSWLGFELSGSVVGEVCLNALGYAVAITLVWQYLRQQGHPFLGLIAVVLLLGLFARFYKWYYWALPLLGLLVAEHFRNTLEAGRTARVTLTGWGLLAGIAWLFRYDLGLETAVFGVLAIMAAWWTVYGGLRGHLRPMCRQLLWFLTMCAALPAGLFAMIATLRGHDQLVLFLLSIRDGAVDSVEAYGIRPFAFDVARPLSPRNLLAMQQLTLIATYAYALILACRELASPGNAERTTGYQLLCVALTGFGVLPQALHRADVQHLLQVVPPFVLALAGLSARMADRPGRLVSAGGCIVATALMIAAVPRASVDLASPWRNPVRYWRTIAGLPGSQSTEPVAALALAIRRLTPAGSNVFLVMPTTRMPLLFFARRHQPGLFPVYEEGIFSAPIWLAHNQAALERTPPDYLVLPEPGNSEMSGHPAPFIADLTEAWLKRYTRTLYVNARYRLLGPE